MAHYRQTPLPSAGIPPGIPYIVGNEAAERFSYYGMRAVLVVFMTRYLADAAGHPATLSPAQATGYFHFFVAATYFTPLLGAILADGFLGKFRTIVALSLVYCLGHLALALDHTLTGLLVGQTLVALGAGGIKPCVSAHVGDQFCSTNQHWLSQVYGWFYMAINLGAFTAMLATPWLLQTLGPAWAFGVPGILMLVATGVFWAGRFRYAHIPPAGPAVVRAAFSPSGIAELRSLLGIYLCVAMFWALFDQTGSSWVIQAEHMNRLVGGFEILPSQIQAANPLLILILTPLFLYGVYPALARVMPLSALGRIAIGMFLAMCAFAVVAFLQSLIDRGDTPHIAWQVLAYALLTSGEVLVSITTLEFSYTQAPNIMKSLVMALFMASVAVGNLFTAVVNFLLHGFQVEQTSAGYFWFFTGSMLAVAIVFLVVTRNVVEERRLQGAD